MPRLKPPSENLYRTDYEKGWRYSSRPNATLNDSHDKSDAWMDGYMDYACSRDKWHFYYCRLSGGCAEHTY